MRARSSSKRWPGWVTRTHRKRSPRSAATSSASRWRAPCGGTSSAGCCSTASAPWCSRDLAGQYEGVDETSALTRRMLEDFDTVAVVGLSADPVKAAHSVPAAMKAYGWRVIPVNPHADELLGEKVYRALADVPEPVELVNVFRPSAQTPDVVRQAVAVGAKAVWLQLGITSAEAREIAESNGLLYVEDRCIAVERARHAIHGPSLRAAS